MFAGDCYREQHRVCADSVPLPAHPAEAVPAETEVIGDARYLRADRRRDLPAIDWNRVNIDAYDLTRSMKARDARSKSTSDNSQCGTGPE